MDVGNVLIAEAGSISRDGLPDELPVILYTPDAPMPVVFACGVVIAEADSIVDCPPWLVLVEVEKGRPFPTIVAQADPEA